MNVQRAEHNLDECKLKPEPMEDRSEIVSHGAELAPFGTNATGS